MVLWSLSVFKAKRSEMEWVLEHSGQDQSVGNEDAVIRLRGIPFECTREMIIQFFSGKFILSIMQLHQELTM